LLFVSNHTPIGYLVKCIIYPIGVYSEDTPMGYLNIKRRLAYAGTQAMFLL
jgi:hypothetical protein